MQEIKGNPQVYTTQEGTENWIHTCLCQETVFCLDSFFWGNPPSRGRETQCVYMQSYNPGVLGWGFLRLLLRLQLRSLSRGVPSSHLEKDERLILGHICIYSWKRHALCYAVFDFPRKGWLITLYGIIWETKYGRFTTLNIPKCEQKHTYFDLSFLSHERDPGWQGYPHPTYHINVIKIK